MLMPICSWIYVDAAVLSTVLWIGRRSWLKVPACQSVLFLDSYRCYLTFLAKIFIYCFILCLLLTLFLKPWSMSTWSSQSFVGPNYRTGGSERKRKLSQFVSLVMSCPPELFVMSDLYTSMILLPSLFFIRAQYSHTCCRCCFTHPPFTCLWAARYRIATINCIRWPVSRSLQGQLA